MNARALALVLLPLLIAGCEACDPSFVSELNLGVDARPGQLVLRGFVDAPAEGEITLTATGSAHVALEGARAVDASGPGEIALELDGDGIAPGGERRLTVTVTPDGALGLVIATILIESDAGDLEVPLVAEIRAVPDCDDDNPCTEDRFDREAVACVNEAAPDQTPCDDGSACTTGEVCAGGRCLGEPLVCEDGVECTVDACDPNAGCVFVPQHSECSDGDPCTDDVCGAGGCENPASPPGTVCLLNGCESMGFCALGECVETPVPDGAPCEDGDICTAGDTCQAGECIAGDRAEIGAARPRGIETGAQVGALCTFLLDPVNSCLSSYDRGPDEVLAARVDGEAVEFAWRGAFHNENGVACAPEASLFVAPRGIDPPEEGGARAPPIEPPDPYCAASVYRTRADLQGVVTEQVSAVRGPVAGAFAGSTLQLAHVDALRSGVWVERTDALGTRAVERVEFAEIAPLGRVALDARGGQSALLVTPLHRTDDFDRTLEEGDSYVVPLAFARLSLGTDTPPLMGRAELPERSSPGCDADAPPSPRPLEAEPQIKLTADGLLRALVVARHAGCGDLPDAPPDPLTGGPPPRRAFHGLLDPASPPTQRLVLLPDEEGVSVSRAELEVDRLSLVRRTFTCVDGCDPEGVAEQCGLICGYSESVRVQPLDDDGPALELGAVSFAPHPFAFDIDGRVRVGLVPPGIQTELRWEEAGLVEQRFSDYASFDLTGDRPVRRANGGPIVVGSGVFFTSINDPDDADAAAFPEPVAAVSAFGCLLDTGLDLVPCMTDLDCGPGERCNTDEVCLPPPDCGPNDPCDPVCYGACEAP